MGVNKRYNSTSNNPNKNRIFIIVRKSLKLKVELPYFEKNYKYEDIIIRFYYILNKGT